MKSAKGPPKSAVPELTARDRLLKERARSVADKYMPDPKAKEGSGPWAAWALERIAILEAALGAVTPAKAAKAPPRVPVVKPKKLTARELAFAQEYIIDRNATQAAIRAGYSRNSAANIGYENVRKPHIAAAINELIKERNQRTGWDPQKLLDRLAAEGDADISEIYDVNNAILPVRDWPLVFRMGLIAGIESNELYEGTGEDRHLVGYVTKVKITERTKIKELIGKHNQVQAFKERIEHDVSTPLRDLYAQISGIGISPVIPTRQAPGIAGANAIRPRDPVEES